MFVCTATRGVPLSLIDSRPEVCGLGMGLAFCHWGADATNGRLYAPDLPAMGACFTVDLPRCPMAVAELL